MGFEPTAPFGVTGFQDQLLKPLGHLSTSAFLLYQIDSKLSRSFFHLFKLFNLYLTDSTKPIVSCKLYFLSLINRRPLVYTLKRFSSTPFFNFFKKSFFHHFSLHSLTFIPIFYHFYSFSNHLKIYFQ